ncbi:MAG: phosphate starvation-inducible protein PhoH [Tagaea sp. CACIAM 22H2]|nr:phosphate starvation-inducible protein PhoH [Tagaea sp. CACIAM 22H2]
MSGPIHLAFDDNRLLSSLYGEHDRHLARIEQLLGVDIASRGNEVRIQGPHSAAEAARDALNALYAKLVKGLPIDLGEVEAAVRFSNPSNGGNGERELFDADALAIATRKRRVAPRTATQGAYLKALKHNELVFGIGPAGTGKTYLAVAVAVDHLITGKVDRIILSRPAVEAGERLGFLPGDLKEKVDPYLRPLYDALHDMLPPDLVAKRLTSGEIEVAPLAFMRGRTLANAFAILDEAQNTTPMQMKMFLTRLGEGSRMVVTGDLTQIDLPPGQKSGLAEALDTLTGVPGIGITHFTGADVVRHPLVGRIVEAYRRREEQAR